jgi:hypothetical protein
MVIYHIDESYYWRGSLSTSLFNTYILEMLFKATWCLCLGISIAGLLIFLLCNHIQCLKYFNSFNFAIGSHIMDLYYVYLMLLQKSQILDVVVHLMQECGIWHLWQKIHTTPQSCMLVRSHLLDGWILYILLHIIDISCQSL